MSGGFQEFLEGLPPTFQEPPPTVPGLLAHIDGDYLAYYASGNEDCSVGEARESVRRIVQDTLRVSGASRAVVHLTAPGASKGERYSIATVRPYQAQRAGAEKPKNHAFVRNYLETYAGDLFRVKIWEQREADDGLAVCAYSAADTPPGYAVLMTRDKDMRMLPGLHVDWLTRETLMVPYGAYEVPWKTREGKERVYGLKWFFLQMLQGDTADNIPGLEFYRGVDVRGKPAVKRMGEKTAAQYLSGTSSLREGYNTVLGLYRGYYGEEEYEERFCEQAALLWLRTDTSARVGDWAARLRDLAHAQDEEPMISPGMWGVVKRLEERTKDARAQADALPSTGD